AVGSAQPIDGPFDRLPPRLLRRRRGQGPLEGGPAPVAPPEVVQQQTQEEDQSRLSQPVVPPGHPHGCTLREPWRMLCGRILVARLLATCRMNPVSLGVSAALVPRSESRPLGPGPVMRGREADLTGPLLCSCTVTHPWEAESWATAEFGRHREPPRSAVAPAQWHFAARRGGLGPELFRAEVARGRLVTPANTVHLGKRLEPMGIGVATA